MKRLCRGRGNHDSLADRQNEQMWQTIVYVILRSISVGVNAELLTNEGRIDMKVG